MLGGPKSANEFVRRGRIPDNHTIQRDRCAFVNLCLINPGDAFTSLQIVENRVAWNMLGDTGQQTHVLHNTYGVAFWSLDWANEAPASAMELTRRKELSRLFHRSLDATEVTECTRVRHAGEHLRDSNLCSI